MLADTVDLLEGFRCPLHPRKRRLRGDLDSSSNGGGGGGAVSPYLDCDCSVGELNFERLMLNMIMHRGGPIWQALVNPLSPKHRLRIPQTVPHQWLLSLLTGASVQQLTDFQTAHPHLPRAALQPLWKVHYLKLCGKSSSGLSSNADSQPQKQDQQLQSADLGAKLLQSGETDNSLGAAEQQLDNDPTDWQAKYEELKLQNEMAWKQKAAKAARERDRAELKRKEMFTTKTLSAAESQQLDRSKRIKRAPSAGAHAPAGSAAASILAATSAVGRNPMQQVLKNMAARKNVMKLVNKRR